jgi:predicted RecB family nuclease
VEALLRGSTSSGHAVPSWVSKRDVVTYRRCPYAFWLREQKKVSKAEMVTVLGQTLRTAAADFSRQVIVSALSVRSPAVPGSNTVGSTNDDFQEATAVSRPRLTSQALESVRSEIGQSSADGAPFVAGTPRQPHDVAGSTIFLCGGGMYRNQRLFLIGNPAGVVSGEGAAEPLEIKAHREPNRQDLIELAFGWRLIEELRSGPARPAGWLWLRGGDGDATQVRLELGDDIFAELEDLIAGVRRARIDGVEPDLCSCAVCSGVQRDTVRSNVIASGNLTAIVGISSRYAKLLRACEITDWSGLAGLGCDEVISKLKAAGISTINAAAVREWQAHARALIEHRPVWVHEPVPFPVPVSYFAFDLEYNSDARDVWLIGVRLVSRRGDVTFSCYTDLAGNLKAFGSLAEMLARAPRIPIVTWNGISADMPMLRIAAGRCGADILVAEIERRHIDLYDWTRRHLRVPSLGLGLKELSVWANIPRTSGIRNGGDADALRQEYRCSGSSAVLESLLAYSREDVNGLVQLVEALRSVGAGRIEPAPYQLRRPRENIALVNGLTPQPQGQRTRR